MASLNFENMFNQHVAENQKVWDHDRSSTVGASEVFGCQRKSYFDKFHARDGYERDPHFEQDWGAMERGNIIEEHWVVPVLESKIPKTSKYLFGSSGQETFVYGVNSATPDGLVTDLPPDALSDYGIDDIESDCILIEIKSFDPRSKFEEEKAIHHGQIQTQMGIIRRMTTFRPMYGVIIYVNASFLSDIRPFVVRYDPSVWKAAQIRADKVINSTDATELRPEGKINGLCEYCPWTHSCAKVSKEAIPETKTKKNDVLDEDIREELRELARLASKAAKDEKEAKEEKETLRAEIREKLQELDRKNVKEDDFSVSWTWIEGRDTIDTKQMAEDGIDLEPYKTPGVGYDRLTVSYGDRSKTKKEG